MKIKVSHKVKILFGTFAFVLIAGLSVSSAIAQVSFDSARNFTSGDGVLSIVSRDFNNDGLLDIATSNKKTDTVSVHLNQGGGIFTEPWAEYHVGPFTPLLEKEKPKALPIGVASGDFNNDGWFDLVVSNSDSDTVSVLLNNGDGTFGAATDFTVRIDGISPNPGNLEGYHILHPEAVTTCDFNGDNLLDIATANNNGSRVSVLLGDGLGNFGFPAQYFVGRQPIFLTCGDFNIDGAFDIAMGVRQIYGYGRLTLPSKPPRILPSDY